jgi:hypothetical protein
MVDMSVAKLVSADPTWIRLVFDLIFDPFDDVRESAVALLSLFPEDVVVSSPVSGGDSPSLLNLLQAFCSRGHDLAIRTGRADHGDGSARSGGLLCSWLGAAKPRIDLLTSVIQRLENKIAAAEKNLGLAAIENPVHGDFASIR